VVEAKSLAADRSDQPGRSEHPDRSGPGRLPGVLSRLRRRPATAVGALLLLLVVLFAVLGPLAWSDGLAPSYPAGIEPSADHPLGTDRLGHDMLATLMSGVRWSVQIAVTAAVFAAALGVLLGSFTGYLRGRRDGLASRSAGLVLRLLPPVLGVILLVSGVIGDATRPAGQWLAVALVIGLICSWFAIRRTTLGIGVALRENQYVLAARALGASTARMVYRHVVPNSANLVVVNLCATAAQTVLLESALSFWNQGVHWPSSSLGSLLSENRTDLMLLPWLFWYPVVLIGVIALACGMLADGLRDGSGVAQAATPRPGRR
jgi:peptide/nickel transport system permease protein